jgi:hypothetical protein
MYLKVKHWKTETIQFLEQHKSMFTRFCQFLKNIIHEPSNTTNNNNEILQDIFQQSTSTSTFPILSFYRQCFILYQSIYQQYYVYEPIDHVLLRNILYICAIIPLFYHIHITWSLTRTPLMKSSTYQLSDWQSYFASNKDVHTTIEASTFDDIACLDVLTFHQMIEAGKIYLEKLHNFIQQYDETTSHDISMRLPKSIIQDYYTAMVSVWECLNCLYQHLQSLIQYAQNYQVTNFTASTTQLLEIQILFQALQFCQQFVEFDQHYAYVKMINLLKDPLKKEKTKVSKLSYCWCENDTIEDDMIQCDQCTQWYHYSCMGITPEKLTVQQQRHQQTALNSNLLDITVAIVNESEVQQMTEEIAEREENEEEVVEETTLNRRGRKKGISSKKRKRSSLKEKVVESTVEIPYYCIQCSMIRGQDYIFAW